MNAKTILKDLKGKAMTIVEHVCPNCKETFGRKDDVTFGDCAQAALLNAKCEAKDKVTRYKLCCKIEHSDGKLSLSADEVTMLKKCIEEFSPIIVVGPIMEILDPNA